MLQHNQMNFCPPEEEQYNLYLFLYSPHINPLWCFAGSYWTHMLVNAVVWVTSGFVVVQQQTYYWTTSSLLQLILAVWLQAYWSLLYACCDLWWCIIQRKPSGHAVTSSPWLRDTNSNLYLHFLKCDGCCRGWQDLNIFIAVINPHIGCLWSLFIGA